MPILEKAAAKLFGNYEMLSGGFMGPAIQSLTGAPYYDMMHDDYSVDGIWLKIKEVLEKNWMVTAASYVGTGSDKDENDIGIAYRHAYSVLKTHQLADGTKLIQCRNPWGSETYYGPWSDASQKWTASYAAEVGLEPGNDGVFWISASDYHRSFRWTSGNPDVQNEHLTYYAAFDLPSSDFHEDKFTITSQHDQTVYISAYTYDAQHFSNGGCNAFDSNTDLRFTHDRLDDWLYPKYGGY